MKELTWEDTRRLGQYIENYDDTSYGNIYTGVEGEDYALFTQSQTLLVGYNLVSRRGKTERAWKKGASVLYLVYKPGKVNRILDRACCDNWSDEKNAFKDLVLEEMEDRVLVSYNQNRKLRDKVGWDVDGLARWDFEGACNQEAFRASATFKQGDVKPTFKIEKF